MSIEYQLNKDLEQDIEARIDWYKNKTINYPKAKQWDKNYSKHAPKQAKLLSPTLRMFAKDTNIQLIPSKIMMLLFEHDQYRALVKRMKRCIENKTYIIEYNKDENLIKFWEYGILPCGHSGGKTTARIRFVY